MRTDLLQPGQTPGDPLTSKQRRFVTEYLRDRDAAAAAVRAGYKGKNTGHTLLRSKVVADELAIVEANDLHRIQRRHGISLERTLQELAKGAFYDVRKLFNEDGSPKALQDLGDDEAAAIEGIEVVELWGGKGEERAVIGHVKRYKLAKRSVSLEMLMRHLGGFRKDNNEKNQGVNALVQLLSGMRRSALPVAHEVPHDDGG